MSLSLGSLHISTPSALSSLISEGVLLLAAVIQLA